MIVYLIMIPLTLLCTQMAYYSKIKYNRKKNNDNRYSYFFMVFLSFIFPFMVSAFRGWTIGTDVDSTYLGIFEYIQDGKSIRDIGYYLINKIVVIFSLDFQFVLIITSLIICSMVFAAVYKISPSPLESILLFFTTAFYFNSMNIIRQSLAMSICIFSINYIVKKKKKKFIICILIATLFHTTALLFLPLYWLAEIRLKIRNVLLMIAVVVVGMSFISTAIRLVITIIPFTARYFSWYFTSKYSGSGFNTISFLVNLCVLIFFIIINKKAHRDRNYNFALWCQTISVILLLFSVEIPLVQRLSWYFSYSLIITIPMMFKYLEYRKRTLLKIALYSGYFGYMFITIFIKGYNEVVPYVPFFK